MRDFKELKVWEKAHVLTLSIYESTRGFQRSEDFGLTAQVRRSSASIPTHIAEGCGRNSRKGFAPFLHIAIGSANEVEYQLLLARDLGYLPATRHPDLDRQVADIRRMLVRLADRVRIRGSASTLRS
jgi:four helix bundle protein